MEMKGKIGIDYFSFLSSMTLSNEHIVNYQWWLVRVVLVFTSWVYKTCFLLW